MHEALEALLNERPMPSGLTDDEMDTVNHAHSVIKDIADEINEEDDDYRLYTELKVPTGSYLGFEDPSICWGTCDVVIVTRSKIIILDLKTGRYPVDPENNWQLIAYLLGAIKEFGPRPVYELGILQPTIDPVPSWWVIDDPSKYAKAIDLAISEALSPAPTFSPGDHQCRFRPASDGCSYYPRYSTAAAFGADPAVLSPRQVEKYLKLEGAAKDFFEKLRKRALQMMVAGIDIPDYKVVRKVTRERWVDPDELYEEFAYRGLPVDELIPRTPLSPSQARRLVTAKALKGLTVKPEGDLTVAPLSDRRKAVQVAEFERLDDDADIG